MKCCPNCEKNSEVLFICTSCSSAEIGVFSIFCEKCGESRIKSSESTGTVQQILCPFCGSANTEVYNGLL